MYHSIRRVPQYKRCVPQYKVCTTVQGVYSYFLTEKAHTTRCVIQHKVCTTVLGVYYNTRCVPQYKRCVPQYKVCTTLQGVYHSTRCVLQHKVCSTVQGVYSHVLTERAQESTADTGHVIFLILTRRRHKRLHHSALIRKWPPAKHVASTPCTLHN